jgi:UDP-galactopyranose mutase
MPLHGYTRMFDRMLSHPNVKVLLNADYREVERLVPNAHVIFTGPIDEYFDFRFGRLPYRSLEFKFETVGASTAQIAPVINFPNENAYTRVTEFKYLTGQQHPMTTVVYEYAREHGDPYYPIPRADNAALYRKYQDLADATPGVHFLGRLGTYKYYNMDQVVAQALTLFAKLSGTSRRSVAVTAA